MLKNSNIRALKTLKENFCVYAVLIGEPATGKSPCMNIVKKCLIQIENINGVDPLLSAVVTQGTVESLLFWMKKLGGSIASFFDESSQFIGSFGRYNGGGANYDRSIYLELANGGSDFRRDLKSERTIIKNPRLNLCINGHPSTFIEAFNAEKSKSFIKPLEPGISSRF